MIFFLLKNRAVFILLNKLFNLNINNHVFIALFSFHCYSRFYLLFFRSYEIKQRNFAKKNLFSF